MKERLIELLNDVGDNVINIPTDNFIESLADHLIANGVIVPPCKVGDTVWAIRDYKGHKYAQQGFVSEMFFRKDMSLMIVVKHIARGTWGEDIFSTKEEAEKALKNNKER